MISEPSHSKTLKWPLFTDRYFAMWSIVLPISSILVVPAVQGTTPGFCFAFFAIIFVPIVTRTRGICYLRGLLIALTIFTGLTIIGQLVVAVVGLKGIAELILVRSDDASIVLRSTLFTQSLYLIAVISTFFFVKQFYRPRWIPYILSGAVLLGVYGVYEVLFYALTGSHGDFASNRTFGETANSGSLFQTIALGPITLQRLKSLAGEPSMYALTALPYWVFALKTGYRKIAYFLLFTLILTTSTTAFLGIIIYMISDACYKRSLKPLLLTVTAVALAAAAGWTYVKAWGQTMLIEKLALENQSGMDRFTDFSNSTIYWWHSSWPVKLFGIGFGTIRSDDLLSTVLVNNGLIGIVLTTCIFFYPLSKLNTTNIEVGLKQICLICFVILMVSVSEYSYLSTWLFVGIAYHYAGKVRQQQLAAPEGLRIA